MIPASQQTYPHVLWTKGMMILQISLDTPLRRVFDYRAPAGFEGGGPNGVPRLGLRVRVPFGRRQLIGILVGVVSESAVASDKLKTALDILDEQPTFDPVTFELLRWAAEYYHHPLGEVFAAALPASLRAGQPQLQTTEWWSLSEAGRLELAAPGARRAPQQRALLACVPSYPTPPRPSPPPRRNSGPCSPGLANGIAPPAMRRLKLSSPRSYVRSLRAAG
jgi:primosomal protein N' (replication factor Y) (superfamily II helicase)